MLRVDCRGTGASEGIIDSLRAVEGTIMAVLIQAGMLAAELLHRRPDLQIVFRPSSGDYRDGR